MRLIDVPMCENDIGAFTVGEFLKMLLITLWEETDSFSGKRPFGNSDWQYQVYASLIKAGYDIGRLDEDGYVDDVDYQKADRLIKDAIQEVFEDEPVKHGRWIEDEYSDNPCVCSYCGEEAPYKSTFEETFDYDWEENLQSTGYEEHREYVKTNYCPNCGAKLDLEDNE